MSPTSYHQTVPKTQSDVGALSRARTIALLKAADGLTYSDPTSYANMLNSQFSSIFNSNETNDSIKPMGNQIYPEKSTINITEGGILKLLSNLKVHKATEPDGLSAILLNFLGVEIAPVFFQASINQGVIPVEWKTADVVPIFKKGAKNRPENYRLVSLTSITCKILEYIIASNTMNHLESIQYLQLQMRNMALRKHRSTHQYNPGLSQNHRQPRPKRRNIIRFFKGI